MDADVITMATHSITMDVGAAVVMVANFKNSKMLWQ